MSKETELVQRILEQIGGLENIRVVNHCMTRVRLSLRDNDQVQMDALKQVKGVMGVVEEDTIQIIVGPGTVNKVAKAMTDMTGVELGAEIPTGNTHTSGGSNREKVEALASENKAKYKKGGNGRFKRILATISGIFIPLIPAFVGAGLIAGIGAIISNMLVAGTISGGHWEQIVLVLNVIKNALFTFLNIYVGINAAKQFGATLPLGGVIGGVVLLSGVTPDQTIQNIFTNEPLIAGQGGIIGVILAVYLLSFIEKGLRTFVPNAIDIIVTPTIALLVTGLATIFLIMPGAGYISDGLLTTINWVIGTGGAISGFLLAVLFLPMVMFGLHQVLTPIHIEMIAQTGMTTLLPIIAMAGAGQVGAAIALWVRCRKNKPLTNIIKGALPVGVLGIGEPLIYGVTLPLGRPFITACLGGGIGGAVIGLFGNVGSIAIGPSGVALIPLINTGHWMIYIYGLLAAYAAGMVLTYFFGVPKSAMEAIDED
ncbi:PTS transporter subunit EIIC [Brochothrix thermosphacta]|uniref:PTS transporter subunit EIIC n=1 Tax=Brochothrix thermosphacta TaxID=2756 RepID=UPI0039AF3988